MIRGNKAKIIISMLAAALAWVSAGANSIRAKSADPALSSLWILAEKNMPGLKARQARLKSLQAALKALPVRYLPDVSLEAGYSGAANIDKNEHGALARIVARWSVWDGGRNFFRRQAMSHKAESERWKRELAVLKLKGIISGLYYDIALLKTLNGIRTEQTGEYKRLIRLFRRRVRIGTVARSDLEELRIELQSLENRINNNKRVEELLRKQLMVLVGSTTEFAVGELSGLAMLAPADFTGKLRFESLPFYRAHEAELRMLSAGKQLARRELYWPTLSFELSGGFGPHHDALDSRRPEVGAGFRFRFPLFSSRDRGDAMVARTSRLRAARLDLKQKLLMEKLRFKRIVATIGRDARYVEKLRELVLRSARNIKRGYREFRRGIKGSSGMMSAVDNHFKRRVGLASRKKRLYRMTSELFILSSYAQQEKNVKKKTPRD